MRETSLVDHETCWDVDGVALWTWWAGSQGGSYHLISWSEHRHNHADGFGVVEHLFYCGAQVALLVRDVRDNAPMLQPGRCRRCVKDWQAQNHGFDGVRDGRAYHDNAAN